MNNITDITDILLSYYDNIIKFIEDIYNDSKFVEYSTILFLLLLIILLLTLITLLNYTSLNTNNILVKFVENNISVILSILIMTLILYILIVFYNKGSEYNNLKLFIGSRTEKLNKIFNDINTNNTSFIKNDVDNCKKLKNIKNNNITGSGNL